MEDNSAEQIRTLSSSIALLCKFIQAQNKLRPIVHLHTFLWFWPSHMHQNRAFKMHRKSSNPAAKTSTRNKTRATFHRCMRGPHKKKRITERSAWWSFLIKPWECLVQRIVVFFPVQGVHDRWNCLSTFGWLESTKRTRNSGGVQMP